LENKRIYLYTTGILLVSLIGMFIWKVIAVKNMEKKMEAQRVKLVERSEQIVSDNTRDFLRLTTIPLVWAVRKEMIKENYDQIDEYLTRFIKERNMKQILVVKSDGTIAVATDKKIEGMSVSSLYPTQIMEQGDINISVDKDGNLQVVAPIMGLNARIGTLILIYQVQKINFETGS
jgi:hypothetical protein